MKFNKIFNFIRYCPDKTVVVILTTNDHTILIIKKDCNSFIYYDNIDSKIIPLDLVLEELINVSIKTIAIKF